MLLYCCQNLFTVAACGSCHLIATCFPVHGVAVQVACPTVHANACHNMLQLQPNSRELSSLLLMSLELQLLRVSRHTCAQADQCTLLLQTPTEQLCNDVAPQHSLC
jgi:hypothetical protein